MTKQHVWYGSGAGVALSTAATGSTVPEEPSHIHIARRSRAGRARTGGASAVADRRSDSRSALALPTPGHAG